MQILFILTLIGIVVSLFPLIFLLRYNIHMFQLNGYKNNEQMRWLKKNLGAQLILIPFAVLAALNFFLYGWFCVIATMVMSAVTGLYFLSKRKKKAKKALVYTNRVKRLIATNLVLTAAAGALSGIFAGVQYALGALCCILFLEPLFLILCNIINRPIEKGINKHYINDAKKILRSNRSLKIIGVTGSYGKTSVKFFLRDMLSVRYNVLVTPESYNTPMGIVKTIRGSLKPTHDIFVCEMGARYVGDIKEICDIVHPQMGVITSIGPQHLETFGGMENIINTKFELADAVPGDEPLFLNGDNEYIRKKSAGYKNAIFYNTAENTDGYRATDVVLSSFGTEFTVVTPDGETAHFQTRLVGEHNIINILGAITVAHRLGVELRELVIPVRRLQPIPHRLQMIRHGNITIIDDAYNSNPVGSKAAVKTLSMFEGVKILVTPGMVELGAEEERYNREFGAFAAEHCDYVVLVGKKHTRPIYEGLAENGFDMNRCKVYETIGEAMQFVNGISAEKPKFVLLENDLPDNY